MNNDRWRIQHIWNMNCQYSVMRVYRPVARSVVKMCSCVLRTKNTPLCWRVEQHSEKNTGRWGYGIILTIYQSRKTGRQDMKWKVLVDTLVTMGCVAFISIRISQKLVEIRNLAIMAVAAFEPSEGYHSFNLMKELDGSDTHELFATIRRIYE